MPDYLDALELTTVEQPFDRVGRTAGELLLSQLYFAEPTLPKIYQQQELPVQLIVRNSSGFAPPNQKT